MGLFSAIFFNYQIGFGENWIRFTPKDFDDSFFVYDKDNLTKVSSTTLLVWEKKISPLEEKLKASQKGGLRVKMRLWEMNCAKRTGKLISVKEFNKDETLLSSINTDRSIKSDLISPGSMGEALFKAVCSKIKK
ncbi:MAG: surface-adhesin E family protein [Pseudomonadota bacterium]